jgi:hypothetical protein
MFFKHRPQRPPLTIARLAERLAAVEAVVNAQTIAIGKLTRDQSTTDRDDGAAAS